MDRILNEQEHNDKIFSNVTLLKSPKVALKTIRLEFYFLFKPWKNLTFRLHHPHIKFEDI